MRQHAATAQVALAGLAPAPQLVTLPRWSGSVDDLAALVWCRVPWRRDGSQLRPRELPRGVCDPAAP